MSDVKVILDVEIGHGVCPEDETEENCKLNKVSEAIQQELLKARINELENVLTQDMFKNPKPTVGQRILKLTIDDRIADLQKELKENSDE